MSAAWQQFTATVWQIVSESALWVMASLVAGGLVHEFLPSSRFRELLNRKGQTAMLGAILSGAVLPICSCGVIPLAVSLYRSGVRLGPVMAFAAATPSPEQLAEVAERQRSAEDWEGAARSLGMQAELEKDDARAARLWEQLAHLLFFRLKKQKPGSSFY